MTLFKSLLRPVLATALLLLLPLVAMQFTREVVWSPADFIVAGVLLFGTGLSYELIVRNGGTSAYRMAIGLTLFTALLLVWLNLAVGLIGSEDNPANLLYGGVLLVGILGALFARLRPQNMTRALLTTALAQFMVPIVALLIWKLPLDAGVMKGFAVNTFFVVLWGAAAWLFRRASTTSAPSNHRLA